jgi:hypothetical protein
LAAEVKEYKGEIIDTHCLTANKADLKNFVAGHTKECVLMPACRASGMNLYEADGTILKFDKASDKKIVEFLEKPDSKLQVVVKAEKIGQTFKLVSIQNQ